MDKPIGPSNRTVPDAPGNTGWGPIAFLIAVILFFFCATVADGQAPRGVVIEPARSKMVAEWNETPDPQAGERAYCVSQWAVGWLGPWDRGVFIIDVERAKRITSDPGHVHFQCPFPGMPTVHTHLPTTCRYAPDGTVVLKSCKRGGTAAYLCSESGPDRESLLQSRAPFAAVQCDKNAFVFYFAPPRDTTEKTP